jgi:hypothetical protein
MAAHAQCRRKDWFLDALTHENPRKLTQAPSFLTSGG